MHERRGLSGSVGAAFCALALAACVSDSPTATTADSGTSDVSTVDASTEASVDAGPCSGKTLCGGDGGPTACADLTLDPNNCGTCGHFCPSKACEQRLRASSLLVVGHDDRRSGQRHRLRKRRLLVSAARAGGGSRRQLHGLVELRRHVSFFAIHEIQGAVRTHRRHQGRQRLGRTDERHAPRADQP